MKSSKIHLAAKTIFNAILLSACLLPSIQSLSNTEKLTLSTSAVFSNLTGTIWVETDGNGTYNGEPGPSGVLVYLYDNEEDTIISQSITIAGKYEFNNLPEGKYYMRIDQSAFEFGGSLFGKRSCLGTSDANDMVDNDDNGTDTTPNDVLCSPFNLTDSDPMSNVSIEYIDFCFFSSCDEPNPLAVPSCEDILPQDIICDVSGLDNLCAIMPTDSSAGNQPIPLCDGFNMSENITWLAFVASDGSYSINISPIDCTFGGFGQQGIQVGIYTDCTFSEAVFCSDVCTTDPISIGGSLLNPGQEYYIYINGCDGNVCSYVVDINGSPTIPSLEPEDVCIFSDGSFQCEDIEYCTDDNIIFQGQGLSLSGEFTWSITTINGDLYLGDSIVTTEENTLILNIPTEGTYNVCLTDVVGGCIDQAWSGAVCREVTTSSLIPMQMDEDFGEFFICEGEFEDFSINEFAAEDPNGDGDSGWNTTIPDYMLGINMGTVSTEGCSYDQQFTLTELPPNLVEDVLISVCEEDLPIQIDAIQISVFSFAGSQTFVLENFLLQNSTDVNGCDSIINLTVEKLNIFQGALLDPICTTDGIVLEFDYIDDLSTDASFITYLWKDPQGNTLPNGANPQTVTAPFESGNGEYTLEVSINKNGVTCIYPYSAFVFIADFLPSTPSISGPDIVCAGENVSVYTVEQQEDETTFIWSFPNDVASASITGSASDTLTIDWTNSGGGEITATAQNNCGQSNPNTFNVQVIPMTTPNFTLDTSICVEDPIIIDFIGSNFNIADFNWDFDGGTILSGTGMGPYEISWDSSGEKTVSLFTKDINGCISETTTKSISVKFPLEPTAVTCNPSVGEIEFTWEIPLMVSGFEVNVISGQTGGVFTANSFTISGLGEGESVTIELLTMPEDPICGEFVSTLITCVSLTCIPPEIELSADPSAVCVDGDNISITATIVSGEPGVGTFTGPGIIDATSGIFDPSMANIGINTILYTYTSDIADCVGSKTISIEVFDLPIASFVQDVDTMCITDELNLTYDGTPNTESITWVFDGGIGSGLLTNQEVTFDSPGLKTISLQVIKDGCTSDVFSSSVLVEPEIEAVNIFCDTVGVDFAIFSWNNIDGVSLFEVQIDNNPPFFTPNTTITVDELNADQTVTLRVTSLSSTTCPGSTSTVMCTTMMSVGIEDDLLSEIHIYPNPTQGLLFLEGIDGQNLTFELYSILGNVVLDGKIIGETINLSLVPAGVYMLKITDKNANRFKDFKIIKGR